jgi:hypothetical protein
MRDAGDNYCVKCKKNTGTRVDKYCREHRAEYNRNWRKRHKQYVTAIKKRLVETKARLANFERANQSAVKPGVSP